MKHCEQKWPVSLGNDWFLAVCEVNPFPSGDTLALCMSQKTWGRRYKHMLWSPFYALQWESVLPPSLKRCIVFRTEALLCSPMEGAHMMSTVLSDAGHYRCARHWNIHCTFGSYLAWILKCRLPSSPWRPCFSMFPAHLKGELTPRGKGTYRCIYPDFWTAVVLFCQWEQEVLLITHDPVRGAALVGPYKADPTLRRLWLCSPHTPSSSLASLMDWTAMALFFYNGTTPACWFV